MDGDRERWNDRWRQRAGELDAPSPFLVRNAALIPERGRALDLAGGAGRNAIWLARRGLEVTLADVSDIALERAERRAHDTNLASRMRFVRVDLDHELPFAPIFDVLVVVDYLNRARRDEHVDLLQDGGVLVMATQTVRSLERYTSPRREFLLETGELAAWTRGRGLELLFEAETENADGRHFAGVIARRPARAEPPAPPTTPETGPGFGPYR
jgi:tellurite methyltransferase